MFDAFGRAGFVHKLLLERFVWCSDEMGADQQQ